MKPFFFLIEILIPIFAVLIIYKKKDLSIVYLPFLFFCSESIERSLSASIGYLTFILVISYYGFVNLPFLKRNVFSIILIVYHFILLLFSSDIERIRGYFFGVISLFLLIPIISEIYRKYDREELLKELSNAAFLILVLFIMNSVFSTVFRYSSTGTGFYGTKSGVWYGVLSLDSLNLLPFALFLVLKKGIKENNLYFLIIYLISIFLVILTFRRSVMVLSILASFLVMIQFLNIKQLRNFLVYGFLIAIVSLVVLSQTNFIEVFLERYEERNLENRDIKEEGRLKELNLVYKDLFIYYDYDPWFGYELFSSSGNYGKNVFGVRSLHTDFASIIHSTGIFGLFLYLSMVSVSFISVWLHTSRKEDYIQFIFCLLAFGIFFINGRYTTISYTSMLFCFISLPLTKQPILNRIKNPDFKKMPL